MVAHIYSRHGGLEDADFEDLTEVVPFFDDNTSLLELGMSCQNGAASQGSFVITNPLARSLYTDYGLTSHTVIRLTEDAGGCEYWLAQGRLSASERGRGDVVGADNIEHHITVDDANVDLNGLAFTEDWVRGEETDTERLYALQAYILNASSSTSPSLRPSTLIIVADTHLAPDTNTVTMPAKTYPAGTQPQEVVDDCATTAAKIYGVVLHHTGCDDTGVTAACDVDVGTLTQISTPNADNEMGDHTNWTGTGTWILQSPGYGGSTYKRHLNPGFGVRTTTYTGFSGYTFLAGTTYVLKFVWLGTNGQTAHFGVLGVDETIVLSSNSTPFVNGHISTSGANEVCMAWTPTANRTGAVFHNSTLSAGYVSLDEMALYTGDLDPLAVGGAPSHLCLLYVLEDDHSIYPSPVKISDKIENWDPDDFTAPVLEPHWDQGMSLASDGQPSISGLVSRYGQGDAFLYVNDPTQEETHDVWIDSYADSDSITLTQATARATAIRNYRRSGDDTIRVSVIVHPEQTMLLTAGMSLQMDTAAVLSGPYRGTYVDLRVVQCSWEPMIDGRYMAHLLLNRGYRRMPASTGKVAPAATTPSDATSLPYNPATSGMTATNMQDAADELDDRVDDLELGQPVRKNSTGTVFTRNRLNLIEGTNITLTVADDSPNDEVDITIASTTVYGGVATDTLFDAKGDLAVGTGSDTSDNLTAGANDTVLMADSAQTTGLKWVASQTPSTQAFGDSAIEGTADTYARGDHKHAMPGTYAGSVILGGSLGDLPPTTPGTYDEEFNGTADTLPANWAWASAPSGSDAWFLNSRWPSHLSVEGTGNTSWGLVRSSFTPGTGSFGLWAKMYAGPYIASDAVDLRMIVENSGSTERRTGHLYSNTTTGAHNVRGLKTVSSVESTAWGVATPGRAVTFEAVVMYMGLTRDGSNNWTLWYSNNGLSWNRYAAPEAHSFTVDKFEFGFKTSTVQSFLGLDWVRSRADLLFPRP